MALGRLIKAKGFRWRLVDAGEVTECRMYTSLSEAVDGLSKTIFGALNFRILLILLFSLLLGVMFCLPPWLLLKSLVTPLPRPLVRQAMIPVVLGLLSWRIANLRFRVPWYATLFYPVVSALSIFIFLRSMLLTVTGRARWKGRVLAIRRVHW